MDEILIRSLALERVRLLQERWGDAVPYAEIQKGFLVGDRQILLISKAEGVFKPAALSHGTLSLRSTLASRYTDEPLADQRTQYDYSPKEERNSWMRHSMESNQDLIYFLQVKPKPSPEYVIFAPVRIVEDDPVERRFIIDLAPKPERLYHPSMIEPTATRTLRLYDSCTVQVRLFQAHFRRAVLAAYRSRCAVCRLPERPLLDGAHITPDRDPGGDPVVPNGLALCALHHRAFDADIMGVDGDYRVRIFEDRLSHPTDRANKILFDHHGQRIQLPRDSSQWPDRDRLQIRLEES